MFPVIFFAIGLVVALFKISRLKKRTKGQVIEIVLVCFIVSNIAADGIFAAFFQAFYPARTAADIGFTLSPFLFEVAMANFGMAVAAFMGIFWRGRYLLGPVIANTIFIYGAAYGHFVQAAQGNTAPYNGGIFLWAGDIIIPTIILILAILYYKEVISKTPQK